MSQTFKVKIRDVGTSVGVIIPQQKLREAHLSVGDEVELALLSPKKDLSGFGIAKKWGKFVRDKKTREF